MRNVSQLQSHHASPCSFEDAFSSTIYLCCIYSTLSDDLDRTLLPHAKGERGGDPIITMLGETRDPKAIVLWVFCSGERIKPLVKQRRRSCVPCRSHTVSVIRLM